MWRGPELPDVAPLIAEYRATWGVGVHWCLPSGTAADGTEIPKAASVETRALAIAEALRWGGPTFELSPDDQLVWAVPLLCNAVLLGGLVAWLPARLAIARGLDLNRAAADLRRLAEAANLTNAALLEQRRLAEGRERWRAEAIHQRKALPRFDLRRAYVIEEPALAAAIRRGDRAAARETLNLLLVAIHQFAGERLEVLKSCYLELVVVVARTAVTAGGASEALLASQAAGLARWSAAGDLEALSHWLREMLEELLDAVARARSREVASLLAEAVIWLREHHGEPIRRDDAARVACLSPSHFSRQLRRVYGCTFTELLYGIRCDRAAELLRRTDKPVGLIAFECGFTDQSWFTKCFRRRHGTTPGKYRARPATVRG